MIGYHCTNIMEEHLNGFAGYDAIRYKITIMDFSDVVDIKERVMDDADPLSHYDVTGTNASAEYDRFIERLIRKNYLQKRKHCNDY